MLRDLSLDELRGYAPDVAEPADFAEFWAAELAAAATREAEPVLRPADTRARHAAGVRRDVPRLRRRPGQSVAAATARERPGQRVHRRVHRVRRRARRPVRLAGLELRGPPAPGHGHPRPGRRVAQRGHARPQRQRRAEHPGLPDPRASPTRATYYYTRLFIDAARAVDGRPAPSGLRGPSGRHHGRQPGRRPGHRRRAPGRRSRRGPARRAVPGPPAARGGDHRQPPVRRAHRVLRRAPRRDGPGVPDAVLHRRGQPRQAGHRPRPCSRWG